MYSIILNEIFKIGGKYKDTYENQYTIIFFLLIWYKN